MRPVDVRRHIATDGRYDNSSPELKSFVISPPYFQAGLLQRL